MDRKTRSQHGLRHHILGQLSVILTQSTAQGARRFGVSESLLAAVLVSPACADRRDFSEFSCPVGVSCSAYIDSGLAQTFCSPAAISFSFFSSAARPAAPW